MDSALEKSALIDSMPIDSAPERIVPSPPRPQTQQTQTSFYPQEVVHWVRFAAIFLISLAVLTAGVASDHTLKLDELLYINAAKAFLAGAPTPNTEHPPFAKYPIAAAIRVFGETPLGFRFASGLAGALIALSGFGLALRFTRSLHTAYIAWLLLLTNGFLFVESRSANLIIFQTAFEVAGVWAFLAAMQKNSPRWFAWCGALLGLSVASRWCGIVALVVCGLYSLIQSRRVTRNLVVMAASSLAAYVVSWIPLLLREHRSITYLFAANRYILVSHAQYVQHMIDSRASDPWWEWIFRFEQPGGPMQLMANPVIASLGLVAIILLLWQRKPLLPALYALHILQWALAHSLPQYYYYYLDAFTWLTIGLAIAMYGLSFKRVRLDVAVTAAALVSTLWPFWAAFRY